MREGRELDNVPSLGTLAGLRRRQQVRPAHSPGVGMTSVSFMSPSRVDHTVTDERPGTRDAVGDLRRRARAGGKPPEPAVERVAYLPAPRALARPAERLGEIAKQPGVPKGAP